MEDIRRTFFHEMGHLVANEINLLYYGGSGTEEISLYPCKQNPKIFCGHTTPFLPPGQDRHTPPPKSRLAQNLLSTIYGCVFQSYACKSDLNSCFDINGLNDANKWIGFLHAHGISHYNKEFANLHDEYFKRLTDEHALDEFMKIKPEEYLDEVGENMFTVKLKKLQAAIAPLIEKHISSYKGQMEKYQWQIEQAEPFIYK